MWWTGMVLIGCGGAAPEEATPPTTTTTPSPVPEPQPDPPRCGDGTVDDGEACDDGNLEDTDACTSACEDADCGDGIVWEGVEGCDEGAANGDLEACTSECQDAVCGDGVVWSEFEDCDDQNTYGHDGCGNDCRVPFAVSLATADATMEGELPDSGLGLSVASAGDVNGDGIDDLILGAFTHDEAGPSAGAAYVVHGPVSGPVDLSQAAAKFLGGGWNERAGQTVAGAGDVNGDGIDDVIIGAPAYNHPASAGAAYVVYGPMTGTITPDDADATLLGEDDGDNAGSDVAAAGDVDGDGFDDLVIGAQGATPFGKAYIVRGPVSGVRSLADADARLIGLPDGTFGAAVAGGSDLDGDGTPDVVVSDYIQQTVYVFSGSSTGLLGPADAVAQITASKTSFWPGFDVGIAGDMNGDGSDDLVIGDPFSGTVRGLAHILYSPLSGTIGIAGADVSIEGENEDYVGYSVGAAGDVNGDGFDDLIVGANGVDEGAADAGAAYLLYGPMTGSIAPQSAANVRLVGVSADDLAGSSVAAGDFNGDGLSDVLVGAYNAQPGGAAYVVNGAPTP